MILHNLIYSSVVQLDIFPYKYPQISKTHFSQNFCARWYSTIVSTCDKTKKAALHLKPRLEFTLDDNSAWLPPLQAR